MSVIEEVRREREDLARVLKKHTGIRKIVEDLYPDSAHFIYELLQNAEDAGATNATFTLNRSALVFEHNGRAFSHKDILAITDIGEGTKVGDDDKIGRFGVGFKAVFVYSETPHIWSPTFSFNISNLVLPSQIDKFPGLGNNTRFEFPFDNPKKLPDVAFAEIDAGLKQIAETTLLFLTHLESIGWKSESGTSGEVLRVQHSDNHFEALKQVGGKNSTSAHFLKFDRPVEGLEKQRIAVAFALDSLPNVQQFDNKKPLAKQFKVIPATPGRVAVFFPAEKETSGLRFHLHAPFVPELSRASIKDTPANTPLFDQLAKLTAAALHKIRDQGLLAAEFLAVLPNAQDAVPDRYECIRDAVIAEMNSQPLTPTYAHKHAPAKRLRQAKATLKELLSEEDIEFLIAYDGEPPLWAIAAALRSSNADRFLAGLAIKQWDVDEFVVLIEEKAVAGTRYVPRPPYHIAGPDKDFMDWLSGKSIEWHQQFYAFLYKELESDDALRQLRGLNIVRLGNGGYSIGTKCFFLGEGDPNDDVLPRVEAGVFSSGKSKTQQENARKLLEAIGVREVGEAEQVEAILKQRYRSENLKPNLRDLKRFITLIEKEPDKVHLFREYFIFEGPANKWRKPSGVFLDQPFNDTGLTAWYEALGKDATRVALNARYEECGIKAARVAKFAEAVGAQTRLEIVKVSCRHNPEVMRLVYQAPGRVTRYEHDEDYSIASIEKALSFNSPSVSRLIWKTIAEARANWTEARYCSNSSYPYQRAPSQLAAILKSTEWIPQEDDGFVSPRNVSVELLPSGFPIDKGWEWLKGIGFGESEAIREQEKARQSQAERQKEALAKGLGFDDMEALVDARWFASLSPEERQQIKEARESQRKTDLPDHSPANAERRAERVAVQAADAPEKRTEERTRSVSVGREAVKEEAAQYLRQQYTDNEGAMVCQICKNGHLLFELDDGSDYFEKVEFLAELNKRHYQNYLALCPNHAAKFQHANGSLELLREMFLELAGNELDVVLAKQDATIYFTKTHIGDLKAVIETDRLGRDDE